MTSEEYDRFYGRHQESTLVYALSLGCRFHDAEDIVHDVFLDVWRDGQRCALQTMVRQRVIKLNRRRERQVDLEQLQRETLETAQQVEVTDCLFALPSKVDQQIVSMKYQGWTDAEIGSQLEKPMTRAGVSKRVHGLRKRFAAWR